MLASFDEIEPLLRCPVTGSSLTRETGGCWVSLADASVRHSSLHGVPVLVDFARSVLAAKSFHEAEGKSPVARRRYGVVPGVIRRLTRAPKRVTEENVRLLVERLKQSSQTPRVLVIGGGTVGKGVEALYRDPEIRIVGIDIYATEYVHVIADAHHLPFVDGSFDGVLIQAVLEHVVAPHEVVAEIRRVLRPGGLVYAETPFLQPVHEGAYDFTRFTESGHRYVFRHFSLVRSGAVSGAGSQLQWAFEYFVRSLFRSRAAGKAAKTVLFWLPWCDRLVPECYNIDAACGVFFLGASSDIGIGPKDAVDHYQGSQK